jgi:hypothetical protein
MKYELKEGLEHLRNQLTKILKNTSQNQNIILEKVNEPLKLEKSKTRSQKSEAWSEGEVREWFSKNSINLSILDHLSPCSGIVLKQIYDMNKRAPEFFYQSLRDIKGINLSSISIFTHFLTKTFDETE